MARIFIVDGAGARAGDLAAARQRFDDANKEAFGADLDVHAHTPQNQIAGINALVATELGEELVRAALYGASVNHAEGAFLDALGSLLDIEREQQTKSRVIATLTGAAGTVVPSGRLAKNANGDTFESEFEAIIRDGGTQVSFIAIEYGPKDVSAGTLTQIVSAQAGWDTITNESEGIIGRDTESDALFRANIKARTAHASIGSISALESALNAAGASRVRVLENSTSSTATVSGVSMPAHSILVIADGGLLDDISRAVENHRGMGVNTYTVSQGSAINISDAQEIRQGRMRFDGNIIANFNMNGLPISGMVQQLNNNATGGVSYAESGNSILTLHSWKPDSTGYEDVGGNISEVTNILPEYTAVTADINEDRIRLSFPSPIKGTLATNAITVKYTPDGGSETTATVSSVSNFANFANIVLDAAIPKTATNVNVAISDIDNFYVDNLSVSVRSVNILDAGTDEPPEVPVIYGEPRNGGLAVWGFALGTVTKWQYRRFQTGSYLDADWVNIPAAEYTTPELLDGSTPANGYSITGFTNNNTCRLDVRAVNGDHGAKAIKSFVFIPSGNSPSRTDLRLDGRLVTITYDSPLKPVVLTSNLSMFQMTGRSETINKVQAIGNKVYCTLSAAIPAGLSSVRFRISSSTNGLQGANGSTVSQFGSQFLPNDAVPGVPSAPIAAFAYRTSSGWRMIWSPNYSGGTAIDLQEYSTRPSDSNIWSPWITLAHNQASVSQTTSVIPAAIRIRASNPNARSASLLGLSANPTTYPFARSIARRLVVGVEIHRDATITTDDFAAIKTSLVNLVESYDIGSALWQADLQAAVERLSSIRLASALTVTSDGTAINGQEQNAYNRWTLSPDDITITFVN